MGEKGRFYPQKGAGSEAATSSQEYTAAHRIRGWVLVAASPVLFALSLPLLFYAAALTFWCIFIEATWRKRDRDKFRTLECRFVWPHKPRTFTYPLSTLDKTLAPFLGFDFTYFYDHDLDVDLLCQSLANVMTDLPLISATVVGFLMSARAESSAATCGVKVEVAETTYTLRDIHHAGSPALRRQTRLHSCGFGPALPWEFFKVIMGIRVPVIRVRITKLSGGGTAVSVSCFHTAMDARSHMKVVELWAQETQRLLQTAPIGGVDKEGRTTQQQHGGDGDVDGKRLPWGREEWGLLPSTVTDEIMMEGAKKVPGLSLPQFWTEYRSYLDLLAYLWYLWLPRGMKTQTFFFSDDFLAKTKAQVMEQLKEKRKAAAAAPLGNGGAVVAGADLPAFVSSNDVACAIIWQAMQRIPYRVRGPSTCVTWRDVRKEVLHSRRIRGKGGEEEGAKELFITGNCVLRATSQHDDPGSASLLELSCLIRQSIQALGDLEEMERGLGRLKIKEQLLGYFLGPDIMDLRLYRDVVFSTFSPLTDGDTDFGQGSALYYNLDQTPIVPYIHTHKGRDRYGANRSGIFVTVHTPQRNVVSLLEQLRDYLPTPPPAPSPTKEQEQRKVQGVQELKNGM